MSKTIIFIISLSACSIAIFAQNDRSSNHKRYTFSSLAVSTSQEERMTPFDIDYNEIYNISCYDELQASSNIYGYFTTRIFGLKLQIEDRKKKNNFEIGINTFEKSHSAELASTPAENTDDSIYNYYSFYECNRSFEIELAYKKYLHRSLEDRFRSYLGASITVPFFTYSNTSYFSTYLYEDELQSEHEEFLRLERQYDNSKVSLPEWHGFYTAINFNFGLEYEFLKLPKGNDISIYTQLSAGSYLLVYKS